MNELTVPLSVCIITRNEEERLPSCLNSVQWAQEIVIVDDFSTDNTPNICKSFRNVTYETHHFEGFGHQKSYAISLAKNDWILNLDADEEVTPKLRSEIIEIFSQRNNTFAGYYIRRKNLWFGRYHMDNYPGALRLFNKARGKFYGYVHERLDIKGNVGQLKGYILHRPKSFETYRNHYETYVVKYAKLSALDYLERGEQITPLNAIWKILILPLLVFIQECLIKKKLTMGLDGIYISLCSALCYHKAYLHLFRIRKESDE